MKIEPIETEFLINQSFWMKKGGEKDGDNETFFNEP